MLTFHSDSAVPEANVGATPKVVKSPNGSAKKRKHSREDHHIAVDDEFRNPDLDMSTSPEAPKSRKKRKSNGTEAGPSKSSKKSKIARAGTIASPVKSKKKAVPREPSPPPKLA